MKTKIKTISIITLILLPIFALAQSSSTENTDQSFIQSRNEASQNALNATSTNKEASLKIFKDIFKQNAGELQSRLENIIRDKNNYPKISAEISSFKNNISSEVQKYKSSNISLSKTKQIGVKSILNKGLFKTLDAKISKLESADTKITAKISLLVASNVDASNTAALLLDAEGKLAIAKSSVTEVESQINNSISSGEISSQAIKSIILDANDKIINAVNAYKLALESISTAPTNVFSTSTPEIQSDSGATSTENEATTTDQVEINATSTEDSSATTTNQSESDFQ